MVICLIYFDKMQQKYLKILIWLQLYIHCTATRCVYRSFVCLSFLIKIMRGQCPNKVLFELNTLLYLFIFIYLSILFAFILHLQRRAACICSSSSSSSSSPETKLLLFVSLFSASAAAFLLFLLLL